MKKLLLIILCLFFLIGCSNKDDKINENVDNNQIKENENKTEEETPKEDLTKETIKEKDKEETKTQNTCTPKKFQEKYKYFYATEEECHKEGESTAFFDITDNVDSRVFTINCDKIVDDCGTTWYGVSYNIYDPEHSSRDDGVVVVHY